jgi:hypothetical protein
VGHALDLEPDELDQLAATAVGMITELVAVGLLVAEPGQAANPQIRL